MKWSCRSVPRREDPALLRGDSQFVADIAIGSRSVRFVRSPVAAGRILSVKRPDVLPPNALIVTGADLKGVHPIVPRLHRFSYITVEQPILPTDQVRYVGQAIAAVVADTPEAAEDIADLVSLDVEPVSAVADLDAAILPGAPIVHPQAPGNVLVEGALRTPVSTRPLRAPTSSSWISVHIGKMRRLWKAAAATRHGNLPRVGSR
jgi:carbon-monoxide dehydrogenase large subunit